MEGYDHDFSHRGWKFSCRKLPMFNTKQMESVVEAFQQAEVSSLPDALYGNSLLRIVREDDPDEAAVFLEINALHAVNGCRLEEDVGELKHTRCPRNGFVPQIPKVMFAEKWREYKDKRSSFLPKGIKESSAQYDWTFLSNYWGLVGLADTRLMPKLPDPAILGGKSASEKQEEATRAVAVSVAASTDVFQPFTGGRPLHAECDEEVHLPMEMLACREANILWYQQFDLFEDDLSDCGLSRSGVRVRVMPSFWFVLMRQEVRVDSVIVRRVDTRMFHAFGSDHILREFTWAEATFEQLRQRGDDVDTGSKHISNESVGTELLDMAKDLKQRLMQKMYLPHSPLTSS